MKKSVQALALMMALKIRPREIGLHLEPTKLAADGGVDTLLTKLEEFGKEEYVDEPFPTWLNFSTFHCADGMTMNQYVVEHDHIASEACSHKLEVPDAVHAYILLSKMQD